MAIVAQTISGGLMDLPVRMIDRDEARLFEPPPAAAMRFLAPNLAPLAVYTFPVAYEHVPFAPPRGVFEGQTLRLEWQTIDGRQPFFHRNADVDEIGYQVCGERTLMTECGTIEFEPGQFARIPLGVAHDNYGREDIHLIFYMHGPARACVKPVGYGEHRVPPFPGWQAKTMVETTTVGLGGPGGSIAYSMADEQLLLDAAKNTEHRLEVLAPSGPPGELEWVYRAPKVWIGHTRLERTTMRRYQCDLSGDEIQFQAEGTRTIVSQRGVVTLNAGEFTLIPRGCAYANLAGGASRHLSVLTEESVPPAIQPSRLADAQVADWLARQSGARREASH